ncbi:MAG: ATP-binding protein [Ktedonobacteraceae bacterium]
MSEQSPSLQAIIKHRQRQEFVGREEELSLFRENIAFRVEDERRHFVFNVFGQGGVGKTSLLRRLFQLAEHLGFTPAWTDETQEDVLAVMVHLADRLDPDRRAFKSFTDRYHNYQRKCQELEADPSAPKGSFAAFASRTLTKVGLRLGRRLPVGGAVFDVVNDDDAAAQVSEWISHMSRKLTNVEDLRLVRDPLEVLTPLFLAGLRKQSENGVTPLFFDTYERTGDYLDDWLRGLLAGDYGEVPSNIVLVISGRSELSRNLWVPYQEVLVRLNLEPFTEQEAHLYLSRKDITDEPVVDVILHLSGRLPLLVATLAAEHPHDPSQVGDPSGTAVDRFLKWVEDPTRRSSILDAALPRYLNKDVLVEVVGDQDASPFFTWLKGMPFVKEQGNDWRYHEIVRGQMLRRKRRESPQEWVDLHGRLADYYQNQLNQKGLANEQTLDDSYAQSLMVEARYHRLCQAPRQELKDALNGFFTTFTLDESFSLHWAEAMVQAGEENAEADLVYWGKVLITVVKAYNEKHYEVTVAMLTMLLNNDRLDVQSLSVAYAWRGLVFLEMGQHAQSLNDLNASLDTYPMPETDDGHQVPSLAEMSGTSSSTFGVVILFVLFLSILLLSSKGKDLNIPFLSETKREESQPEMLEGGTVPIEARELDEEMVELLREYLTRLVRRKLTENS